MSDRYGREVAVQLDRCACPVAVTLFVGTGRDRPEPQIGPFQAGTKHEPPDGTGPRGGIRAGGERGPPRERRPLVRRRPSQPTEGPPAPCAGGSRRGVYRCAGHRGRGLRRLAPHPPCDPLYGLCSLVVRPRGSRRFRWSATVLAASLQGAGAGSRSSPSRRSLRRPQSPRQSRDPSVAGNALRGRTPGRGAVTS